MSKSQMRQLREEEDRKLMAAMAAAAQPSSEEDDEDEEEQVVSRALPSKGVSGGGGVATSNDKKKKKKKKKKKPTKKPLEDDAAAAVAPAAVVAPVVVAPPPASKPKKQISHAAAAKPKKNVSRKKADDDRLDKLLDEFASKRGEPKVSAPVVVVEKAKKKSRLEVDVSKLDYRQDLKEMFGASIAKTMTKKKRAGPGKTWISSCNAEWPHPRALLDVKVLGVEADDGATVYGFDWTPQYAAAESEYLDCVASNQPSTLVLLLQRYGFHSGALLQLTTLSQKSGQFDQAADLLERAVYFFEHCIGSTFRLDDPLVRMPYAHRENQALFVALFKWCSMLGRKGCTRSALECCKLLLSWDRSDPLDVLLLVDWLALRSEENAWLVELVRDSPGVVGMKKLSFYPNLAFGVAFALRSLKREKEAREAMKSALTLFPECAMSVFSALKLNAEWKRSAWFSQFSELSSNAQLNRTIAVYCSRSKDMWRWSGIQEFVSSVATELAASGGAESERESMLALYENDGGLQLPSLVKHMMLAEEDIEGAAAQIPAALLQEALNLDALNAPPPADSEVAMARLAGSDAHMPSIEAQIEELRRAPTANGLALFLHSLMPWNAPNAPPEQAETEEGLLERARALLGLQFAPRQPRERISEDEEEEIANTNAEDSSTEE